MRRARGVKPQPVPHSPHKGMGILAADISSVGRSMAAMVKRKNERLALGIPRQTCHHCKGTRYVTPTGSTERVCPWCFGRGYKMLGPEAPSGSWFEQSPRARMLSNPEMTEEQKSANLKKRAGVGVARRKKPPVEGYARRGRPKIEDEY
jgi:hypothetical protein